MFSTANSVVGPVRKDGKQSITLCDEKSGVHKTYITDKSNVDAFLKSEEKCNENMGKATAGWCAAMLLSLSSLALENKPTLKKLGWAGVALGCGYGVVKMISAFINDKESKRVIDVIKNENV